jgi:hypothetical protein
MGMLRIGSGKASVKAAAAKSASSPAKSEAESPAPVRLAIAAAIATAAPAVTASTSGRTPGVSEAALVLTWSMTPFPSAGGRPGRNHLGWASLT